MEKTERGNGEENRITREDLIKRIDKLPNKTFFPEKLAEAKKHVERLSSANVSDDFWK